MQTTLSSISEAITVSQILASILETESSIFSFPELAEIIDLTTTYSLLLAKKICTHPEAIKRVKTVDMHLLTRNAHQWITESLLEDNANSLEAIFDANAQATESVGRVCGVIDVINMLKEAHIIPDIVDLGTVSHAFQQNCGTGRKIDAYHFLKLLEEITNKSPRLLYQLVHQLLTHNGYTIVNKANPANDIIYASDSLPTKLTMSETMTKSDLVGAQADELLDADESETKLSNKIERLIEHNVCNSRSTLVNDLLTMSHHAKYISSPTKVCAQPHSALQARPSVACGAPTIRPASADISKRGSAHEGQLNADLIAVYSRLFYAKYRSLLIKKINPTLIMPGGRTYQLRHKLGFMYDSIKRFYGTTQYVSFNSALSFLLVHMKHSGLTRRYLSEIVMKSLDVKLGGQYVMSELGFAEMLFIAALSIYHNDNGKCDMMTIEEKVMRVITIIVENR
ncbi:hypothetical protein GL50803_008858 [Giardia duodenalis]|uniref:Uncharacterized protein n=1 Tax=Giardia intestinalis (strain ATCC 50803 / WB clone C6) TaxID=184922 RepID=A8BCE0_GIAIC|nr:hypothetical protein GL50803_008858 [Giardia intestinalis]KAE8301391.1 hypothetical protein GL50803_008858 [Giardia intestinalis]|eukprot:XP_001707881.1 Hypothetical protein GL50803_8858 [Giardia lamblia ATCC 50803]